MDPSFPYSAPDEIPQESKLATYMNRAPATPNRSLSQAMSSLSLESSPPATMEAILSQPPPPQGILSQPPPPQAILSQPPPPQAILSQPPPPQGILSQPPPPQAILSQPPPPQAMLGHPPPPQMYQQVMIGEFVPINYYSPPPMMPEPPQLSPQNAMSMPINTQPQVHQENVGGTTYFFPTNSDGLIASGGLGASGGMGPEQCLAVPSTSAYVPQMYGAPPHMPGGQPKPGMAATGMATTYYMPEPMKEEMYPRDENLYYQPDSPYPDIPEEVELYVNLIPLEESELGPAVSFRAMHRQSGEPYALRRLPGCSEQMVALLDAWTQIDHPNIVRLHRVFGTRAFGDYSLMLVYDYHPGCVTLMNQYLSGKPLNGADLNGAYHDPFSADPDAPRPYTHQKNAMLRAVACGALVPETVIWNVVVQLTAALRAIHDRNLACRTLDATKVIMYGSRVRIAWCGIADFDSITVDLGQAQQDDLTALGRLTLALASRAVHVDNVGPCLDLVSRTYSHDLRNILVYLLNTRTRRTVGHLMPMIGARFYNKVESLQCRVDVLEEQLAHEADNGRLLRTLMKIGAVNERPELNLDTTWAETGDRYMLKLFRDYLFHSVTADGRPWLDQAHIAFALNNLDGGSPTRVVLMSRDEQSILVVSFSELKHCLEQAFQEVMRAAGSPPP